MSLWCSSLSAGCAEGTREFKPLTDVRYKQEEWKYRTSKGTKLVSEHYDIYTTLKDDLLIAALPQAMETALAYYQRILPNAGVPEQHMPVYLFVRRGEFEDFTRRRFPAERSETLLKVRNGGFNEGGVTVAEYVSHETTFPLITHEGFHQYLTLTVKKPIPAWLNEGLAVTCEGQRWSKDGLVAFDPTFNPGRQAALIDAVQHNRLFPLPELLRINAGHVVGGSPKKIAAYYGQLWGLMLFLRDGEGGKYAEGLKTLLSKVGSDDLEAYAQAAFISSSQPNFSFGEALFAAFISPDTETVQAEFENYIRETIMGGKPPPRRKEK